MAQTGRLRWNIRCAISFNTLAESFGPMLLSQVEDTFTRNRESIERIAKRLISGGRPSDAEGWCGFALLIARCMRDKQEAPPGGRGLKLLGTARRVSPPGMRSLHAFPGSPRNLAFS